MIFNVLLLVGNELQLAHVLQVQTARVGHLVLLLVQVLGLFQLFVYESADLGELLRFRQDIGLLLIHPEMLLVLESILSSGFGQDLLDHGGHELLVWLVLQGDDIRVLLLLFFLELDDLPLDIPLLVNDLGDVLQVFALNLLNLLQPEWVGVEIAGALEAACTAKLVELVTHPRIVRSARRWHATVHQVCRWWRLVSGLA